MVGSLGDVRLVWWKVKQVATTAILICNMIIKRQLAICAGLDIGLCTDSLRLYDWNLHKTVAIVVVLVAQTALTIDCHSRLAIVGHERCVQRSVIIQRLATTH